MRCQQGLAKRGRGPNRSFAILSRVRRALPLAGGVGDVGRIALNWSEVMGLSARSTQRARATQPERSQTEESPADESCCYHCPVQPKRWTVPGAIPPAGQPAGGAEGAQQR